MGADEADDGVGQVVGRAETPEDGVGHVCADGGVFAEGPAGRAVGAREKGGGWGLADVVEEDGEGEAEGTAGAGRGEGVEHDARVDEHVAFGMELGGLFDADHGGDFGEELREEAGVEEGLEGLSGMDCGEEGLEELVADALGADLGDVRGGVEDGGPGAGVDGKAEGGGEAHGAEHAEAVFGEAAGGVADGADDAGVEVGAAPDVVGDFAGAGVEEESVDREVAAEDVGAGVGEGDGGRVAAVEVGRFGAEGGDFDVFAGRGDDGDDAKGLADGDGGGEEGFDLVGEGRGGDIPVVWGAAEEEVADASADEPGFVAGGAEGTDDGGREGGGEVELPEMGAADNAGHGGDALRFWTIVRHGEPKSNKNGETRMRRTPSGAAVLACGGHGSVG